MKKHFKILHMIVVISFLLLLVKSPHESFEGVLLIILAGIIIATDSFWRIKESLINMKQSHNKVLLALNILRILTFIAIILVKSVLFIVIFMFLTLFEDFFYINHTSKSGGEK